MRLRALWIVDAMMMHIRIEVRAGRRKRRGFTLASRVNVKRMLARRKILEVESNLYTLTALAIGQRRGGGGMMPPPLA